MRHLIVLIALTAAAQTLPTSVPIDDHSASTTTRPFAVYANVGALPATNCIPNSYASVTGTGIYKNMATGSCAWVIVTGGNVATTTNTLVGDGAGGAVAATGTGTNCVKVNGTSGACSAGGATIANTTNIISGDNAGNGISSGIDAAVVTRKYFGTAAPGSVAGNLPGDLFSDTTNHNEYYCGAPSGTAAPACTAVGLGNWTIASGVGPPGTNGQCVLKTTNYTLAGSDSQNCIVFNGTNLTLTMPAAAPSINWQVAIINLNSTALAVSTNSLLVNGNSSFTSIPACTGTGGCPRVWFGTAPDAVNYTAGPNPAAGGGGTTLTTKGDIQGYNTTAARIPVGSNGKVLTADSTDALGVSWQTPSAGGSGFAGTNAQTTNYTLLSGDLGKLVTFSGTTLVATLPSSPPSSTWWAVIQNLNASPVSISRNGLNINGAATNLTLNIGQTVTVYTDGTNYFAGPPIACGAGATCTYSASGVQVAADPAIVVFGSADQSHLSPRICIDTSSSTTAYTANCGTALAAYDTKQVGSLFFNTANSTTTPTVAINGLTAKTIVCGSGAALPSANVLKPGEPYTWTYDGTNIRVSACPGTTDVKIIPSANCVAGTAGGSWSTATSNFTPTCRAGSNNLGGMMQAIPSTGAAAQFNMELPLDWDTTVQPFINIFYGSGTNTSGTVIWTVSTGCSKEDGSVTDDPSFHAETAFAAQTMAAANRMWSQTGQFTQVTSANSCVGGSTMIVKVAVSGTAAANINAYQAVVSIPRVIVKQAN